MDGLSGGSSDLGILLLILLFDWFLDSFSLFLFTVGFLYYSCLIFCPNEFLYCLKIDI